MAELIAETLKVSKSKDYTPEYINDNIASHSAEVLIERAKEGHELLTTYREIVE